jgi:hypothetical protein
MSTTPYNTGKVLIGCHYQPPRRVAEPSRTETLLQTALLNDKSHVDWDGIVIVVGCAFLMAVPYLLLAVWS